MGIVDGSGLGCECSGIIKEIGPEVKDLKVGDRVCVFGPDTYATILRTTSDHCAVMPDELSFEDAATMPCVYGTVIHGVIDLARLERGQVRVCVIHKHSRILLTIFKDYIDSFRLWRYWNCCH